MTHDNSEHTHEPEKPDGSVFSPQVAAVALSIVLTLGLFLALGNITHKRKTTNATAVPPRPTITVTVPSAAPSPSMTARSPSPSIPARASIRWRGTLTLSGYGDYKDLDAVPPRKSEKGADVRGDPTDPKVNGFGDVQIASVGKRLLPAAECATAAYAQGADNSELLEKGDVLCVATSAGHVARLQTIDSRMDIFVPVTQFRVVVWNISPQSHG